MKEFLDFWPVIVFMVSLFMGGMGVAIGLSMWIMGKLAEQDAKRIELKEVLLKEIRDGNIDNREKHDLMADKINEMGNRLTRIETRLFETNTRFPQQRRD